MGKKQESKFSKLLFSRTLLWDSVATSFWGAIGKAVGFIIPVFIAVWFGMTYKTDVVFFAYGIVILITSVFARAVENVIVPFIAEIRMKEDNITGVFAGTLLVVVSGAILLISGLFLLILKPFLGIVTRFSYSQLELLFRIFLIITPLMLFVALTSILNGILTAYKIFRLPAISPAFRGVIAIAAIFMLKPAAGIYAIPLGYVIGEVFRFLILATIIITKKIFPLKPCFVLNRKMIEFLKIASFQCMCLAASGINPLVDKTMGSWLQEGSVSILHYAERLYMIPLNLVTVGFLPVVLSYWSNYYYKKGSNERLFSKMKRTAYFSTWISIPFVFVLILLQDPIVRLVFSRGAFPVGQIPLLQRTWIFYLVGLVPHVIAVVFLQAYLVIKKTAFLMRVGIFSCVLNVIFNYILMKYLGVAGIALSTSISAVIMAIVLFIFFPKDREGLYETKRL